MLKLLCCCLIERDQQLDLVTRVCETLTRRLEEAERSVALSDADLRERESVEDEMPTSLAVAEAYRRDGAIAVTEELFATNESSVTEVRVGGEGRLSVFRVQSLLRLISRLPLLPGSSLLRWAGKVLRMSLLLTERWTRQRQQTVPLSKNDSHLSVAAMEVDTSSGCDKEHESGAAGCGEHDFQAGGENRREAQDVDDEDERDEEDEDEDCEDENDDDEHGLEERLSLKRASKSSKVADAVAAVTSAVAFAQADAQKSLKLPPELLTHVITWERQQMVSEGEWRHRQSRLNAEFEERKRRLQEQQIGQRKKLRETCDEALRPLYDVGTRICTELENLLVGRLCRLCATASNTSSLSIQHHGPLARIKSVTFSKIDSPLRVPNCPLRSISSMPVSGGVIVTLEKIVDRNGIAMLPLHEDPIASFSRSSRTIETRVPLRLLGSRVHMLSDQEAASAFEAPSCDGERIFIVRYSGGDNGSPIEPVQILPEGLSLAEYDISFAAGISALRVEHRADGPVKCRAEPAARKEVFSETPVELYTQEINEETHNIVQLYFSDLRDEVAVDVINLTNTSLTLQDPECSTFQQDATGAALNYKIIVRDGSVVSVLYQEGEEIHSSPFIEHKLPPPGSYVVLNDGSLGKLQAIPRGLIVARNPRDFPENAPQWPPRSHLRPKGKHPAELPGMVDVQIIQQDGAVLWPPHECSVPVCALAKADSSQLQAKHSLAQHRALLFCADHPHAHVLCNRLGTLNGTHISLYVARMLIRSQIRLNRLLHAFSLHQISSPTISLPTVK